MIHGFLAGARYPAAADRRRLFADVARLPRALRRSKMGACLSYTFMCGSGRSASRTSWPHGRQRASIAGRARRAAFRRHSGRRRSGHVVLVEVYRDADASAAHKQTPHYAAWRDTVAEMMAQPRSSTKFSVVFPRRTSDWES